MTNIIEDTWEVDRCNECGKKDSSINGFAGNPREWFCSDECMNKCRQRIDEELEKENMKGYKWQN